MDAVEEIKSRLDIVDIVQEYIPLKPAGTGSFKAACPFHQEKTPSFYVNRPRQGWHCFGCDQGGDLISFVMRMEGMEFREALEFLAAKTGVDLPAFNSEQRSQKKRLYEINDLAARWFRHTLVNSPLAEHARSYAAKRHIDDLTGDLWRIGYAPQDWSALTQTLKEKGVTEQELVAAGLAARREKGGGIYDRFRDRLMFSICDVHGNIIGFTGRTLAQDAKEAKYVNTPETLIYKKSAVLYGLHLAKGEIKRQDVAVLVEGNMDVVSSHRIGMTHVIAASGTALTLEHLRLIKRFTKNIAIAFDQDKAGMAATVRGLDLARQEDFSIRIITLPPDQAKDPDELISKNPDAWKEATKNAIPIIDWLYRRAFHEWDPVRPEGKKGIAHALIPEFSAILDPVERDSWVIKLSNDLQISDQSLRELLRQESRQKGEVAMPSVSAFSARATTQEKTRQESLQERLWALLEKEPTLKPLAGDLVMSYPFNLEPPADLLQYLAIIADREFENPSLEALQKELRLTIALLRDEYLTRKRQSLEQEMRAAEQAGDTARIQELLIEFNNLR